MIEIHRILCPVDFSDHSRRALDHAVAIARWYGSTVTLFHVCAIAPATYAPGTPLLPSVVLSPEEREAFIAALRRFAESETGLSVPFAYDVAEGNGAAEILGKAAALPADLLVMGTHGRSGFERFILGSVTEKVLRKATVPVLSVPPTAPDVVPVPPVLFKRILCAVDFSDCSLHALTYALSLAQEADAHLTVAHVIEVPEMPWEHETVMGGPHNMAEYFAATEADRRSRLEDLVPDSVRQACTIEIAVVNGKPYREILSLAQAKKAELIVAGVHGRNPADLAFFGSTAQHLVRRATCPVLTLRKG